MLVIAVDARHPLFHFPPSLYRYVTQVARKPLVMVLNKVDLVSAAHLRAWTAFFARHFPLLRVVPFSSFPVEGTVTWEDLDQSLHERRRLLQKSARGAGGEGRGARLTAACCARAQTPRSPPRGAWMGSSRAGRSSRTR
jgi:ribosome biogenesis GTPase A